MGNCVLIKTHTGLQGHVTLWGEGWGNICYSFGSRQVCVSAEKLGLVVAQSIDGRWESMNTRI